MVAKIELTNEQAEELDKLASSRGQSISELILSGVAALLRQEPANDRDDLRGCLKRLIATPLAPGIEITWLPSVVPAGPKKKEFAVPERTTVGSPGFQSRASAESMSTTFETPSQAAGPPAQRQIPIRADRSLRRARSLSRRSLRRVTTFVALLDADDPRHDKATPSAKDVETFPAHSRHPVQALNGGTSLEAVTASRRPRPETGRWRLSPLQVSQRKVSISRHEFGLTGPGLAAPETSRLHRLRKVSWSGWERLYLLRSAISDAQAPRLSADRSLLPGLESWAKILPPPPKKGLRLPASSSSILSGFLQQHLLLLFRWCVREGEGSLSPTERSSRGKRTRARMPGPERRPR